MYDEAQTFLILKYGSIALAYRAWQILTSKEQDMLFTNAEHELLCEYEYEVVYNFGTSPDGR